MQHFGPFQEGNSKQLKYATVIWGDGVTPNGNRLAFSLILRSNGTHPSFGISMFSKQDYSSRYGVGYP